MGALYLICCREMVAENLDSDAKACSDVDEKVSKVQIDYNETRKAVLSELEKDKFYIAMTKNQQRKFLKREISKRMRKNRYARSNPDTLDNKAKKSKISQDKPPKKAHKLMADSDNKLRIAIDGQYDDINAGRNLEIYQPDAIDLLSKPGTCFSHSTLLDKLQ